MAIPFAVRKKLVSVERHQRGIKRLLAECEAALGLEETLDDDLLSWVQQIDNQGRVCSAKQAEKLAERFLALQGAAKK